MINKLKKDLIDVIIKNFNDSENNDKIKSNIVDPLIIYIFDKFYPYLIISAKYKKSLCAVKTSVEMFGNVK